MCVHRYLYIYTHLVDLVCMSCLYNFRDAIIKDNPYYLDFADRIELKSLFGDMVFNYKKYFRQVLANEYVYIGLDLNFRQVNTNT